MLIDQWDRREHSEINPHLRGQCMTEEARTYSGVKTVYSVNGVGKIGETERCKKRKLEHLTPYTRINSKCIKELNVRLETIKLLEENISSKTSKISLSNIFSDISPWIGKQKKRETALICVPQLVGHRPTNRKVAGLNPAQGMCLGCGFSSWLQCVWEAPVNVSLPFSLPPLHSKNKILKKN